MGNQVERGRIGHVETPTGVLERVRESQSAGIDPGGASFRQILQKLPTAIYATDAEGRITFYNDAVASLWGRRPKLGEEWWRSSGRQYRADGTPMVREETPMAVTLATGQAVAGTEGFAERPDGGRYSFLSDPTPLHDDMGRFIGAVNVLIDITERKRNEEAAQRLASIVESSDDAILSKDIDGVITSWNSGAQRLFGYTAEEAVGQPVTILIPADRPDEEPMLLERIRRGEKIDQHETIRQRKDGSLVNISLSVSPIRDCSGNVIGASKIARDATERKRAQERQDLLLREMDHRVKNLFSLAIGVVSLSARTATNVPDLVKSCCGRLSALARAHALTLPHRSTAPSELDEPTTLHSLLRAILAPYDGVHDEKSPFSLSGSDIEISGSATSSLALLLHEFATNSTKYGALSTSDGRIEIEAAECGDTIVLTWAEHGAATTPPSSNGEGFGALLTRRPSAASSAEKSPMTGVPMKSSYGYPCRGSGSGDNPRGSASRQRDSRSSRRKAAVGASALITGEQAGPNLTVGLFHLTIHTLAPWHSSHLWRQAEHKSTRAPLAGRAGPARSGFQIYSVFSSSLRH